MKKLIALLLALVMCLGLFAGCGDDATTPSTDPTSGTTTGTPSTGGEGEGEGTTTPAEVPSYTYNSYSTALGNNWNPHTWETNADQSILGYLSQGFVGMQALDTELGVYQWTYGMATAITDVTADNQGDLTKYAVTLPEGQTPETTTSGYVFEIALRPEACWEDGTSINADSYIYSMQQLLNPEMKNYRANLYIAGESALAGANNYYYSGSTAWMDAEGAYAIADLVDFAAADGTPLMIAPTSALAWLGGNSLKDYVDAYGDSMFDVASFDALVAQANAEGYVELNADTLQLLVNVITFSPDWGQTDADACNYLVYGKTYDVTTYDTVGCYKVDDYTIRYVCQTAIDINYFLTSMTDTWLVYEELYEAGKDTSGNLTTTDYGTSLETSMSYGPYRMESYQADRQMVFVQNENWYGWEEKDGALVSYTDYTVDGETRQRYQTTRVVVDVMEESAAKQAFLKGELSSWTPNAEELTTYATSDRLYKVDETYTMSFFFNTDEAMLKEMDNSKGNTNSVVLSNINFRKAMSLAIDRDEYVTATEGWKSAYALMNNLYFYDVYNDPTSSYRNSDAAMQAVCNLYGIEYGEGTAYATLRDAYTSVSGYNLTEAKALMKTAHDELVSAGLYTSGEDIVVRIGWAAGALTSSDQNQLALLNKFVNAALEGSGFGKITFEAIGNISNRYADVPAGEYAIGYGAWGGAAFYPFRNLQVYADPDQYDLNEAACWDPTVETATLTVGGEEVTMTWQDWSNALIGTGAYATASNEVKLEITAQLEQMYLEKYYRIPLAGTTICEMLSYKNSYYTEDYNIMYGFGGLELMTYNYNDAEWTQLVADMGGELSYE